ncbi:FMN-dependent oxidoreductase, nitrilotriacetate monooxygenase family [Opitutaceae bacterium TAV1]|nr:FMN-dependent oxidoreductase, nitrilotriacetate monooxygenase family [Opitutaceae bacterium TAV1]
MGTSSSVRKPQIKLGLFIYPNGHHVASWRHPDATADGHLNFEHYRRLVELGERAKFDTVFLADSAGIHGRETDVLSRTAHGFSQYEPITLLSSLAAITRNIGLVATASTSFNEPYNLARKFASLDHLSGGRAGWNIVTSSNLFEAKNFNLEEHYAHADRYARAEEFVDVVTGLWDSWDDDAFIRDKTTGRNFDPAKLHVLDHRGAHYSVRGPLNVARPPQGYPVLVQAGSSDAGQELAARTSEVIFTAHTSLANARAFYASLKGRLHKYGRTPDQVKIMPGVQAWIGRTEQEARDKYERVTALIQPEVGLSLLSALLGNFDLSPYPVDGPLPFDDLPSTNGSPSRQQVMIDLARRENLTIRQLYEAIAGARGHWTVIGTPVQVADQLEEWFVKQGADGFNVMAPYLPGGLEDFANLVIPELQRRGLFRTEYEGRTLRENLGLARPVSRHARVRQNTAVLA